MTQTVSKIVESTKEKKNRRSEKGRVISLSRRVYQLSNRNTFYVESETTDNRYYFVRFEPSVFEWCSCMDYGSNRADRCKHIFAIEHAIRMGTLKEVEHLPEELHIKRGSKAAETIEAIDYTAQRLTYQDDDYSF